jgi:hypothetical protein
MIMRQHTGRRIREQAAAEPLGVTSPHAGSKPSFTHLTRAHELGRYKRAADWSQDTGRPLPPHMRIRTRPVRRATPMGDELRLASYLSQRVVIKLGASIGPSPLTGPQRRRRQHKRNRAAGR